MTEEQKVDYNGLDSHSQCVPGDWVPYGSTSVQTPGGFETELNGLVKVRINMLDFEDYPTDEDIVSYVKECLRDEPYHASVACGQGRRAHEEDLTLRITEFKLVSWHEDEAVIEPLDYEYD
jgi:hypothetical protein